MYVYMCTQTFSISKFLEKDWLDADSNESIVRSKATRVHSKRLSVQEFFLRMAAPDADPLANEESRI